MNLRNPAVSVLPLVPVGRAASEFAVQEVARGVLGTRDLLKGTFVPAVRSGPTSSVLGGLKLPAGSLGVVLGIANLGLGIFNGVISWRTNNKVTRVLHEQELQSRHLAEIRDVVQCMGVDPERRHTEVMAGFDFLVEHDLRSSMFELTDRLEELAERPIVTDAQHILNLTGARAGQIQSLLTRIPSGASDRLSLVQALAFTRVAEADARFVLASADSNHLHHAVRLREKAADQVSREIRDALQHNHFTDLLGEGISVPVQYWGLRAGLQALSVTQDQAQPRVLDVRWESGALDRIRSALTGTYPEDASEFLEPVDLEEAEVVRQLERAPTIGLAHCWESAGFMALIGSPDRPAAAARPVLEAIVESGWMDAFAAEISVSDDPPAKVSEYTFDALKIQFNKDSQTGHLDSNAKALPEESDSWAESMVCAALKLYDVDGYEDERPLRAELVLQAARDLPTPRPVLVDWAVRTLAHQRLCIPQYVRSAPNVELVAALQLAASRGVREARSNSAILLAQVHVVQGLHAQAADALDLVIVPGFSVEQFHWLVPLLRLREVNAEDARQLYERWLEEDQAEAIRALCEVRQVILAMRSQQEGPSHELAADFKRANGVLEVEPALDSSVLRALWNDFKAASQAQGNAVSEWL